MVRTPSATAVRAGAVPPRCRTCPRQTPRRQVAPTRLPGQGNKPGRRDIRANASRNGPRPVAWCGFGARSVAKARDLAHRGDVAGLGAVLAEAPDLLLPSYAAAIMQAAALAGRAEIVRMLLAGGVGTDHPFYLPVNVTGQALERVVFVTPLCAARMKRRFVVVSLLLAAGAREDVFTSAPRCQRERSSYRRPGRHDRRPGSQRDSAALRCQGRFPADHRSTHRPRSGPRRPRQPRPHAA
jgi:hypothetical protein